MVSKPLSAIPTLLRHSRECIVRIVACITTITNRININTTLIDIISLTFAAIMDNSIKQETLQGKSNTTVVSVSNVQDQMGIRISPGESCLIARDPVAE